jgi:hypothetical protein
VFLSWSIHDDEYLQQVVASFEGTVEEEVVRFQAFQRYHENPELAFSLVNGVTATQLTPILKVDSILQVWSSASFFPIGEAKYTFSQ